MSCNVSVSGKQVGSANIILEVNGLTGSLKVMCPDSLFGDTGIYSFDVSGFEADFLRITSKSLIASENASATNVVSLMSLTDMNLEIQVESFKSRGFEMHFIVSLYTDVIGWAQVFRNINDFNYIWRRTA